MPLITAGIESRLYRAICSAVNDVRCEVIAIGGIEDHVHMLAELSTATPVAEAVKHAKGASSHLMTHALKQDFKWQTGYAAISVSPSRISIVERYVRGQKEHHQRQSMADEWRELVTEALTS